MNIFVFDIETIPDTCAGKVLYELDDSLSDASLAEAMFSLRLEKTSHDFLPLHLQKVVALSVVFQHKEKLQVFTVGDESCDEKTILQRFFQGIEKYTPMLVTWNGGGFDLPVLHYRSLVHGISAPRYWEKGDNDTHFKWNNYLSRYHYRHLDLMDVLAAYNPRANAPLDDIANMIGAPGKMGVSGSQVWPMYQQGQLNEIRNYCETDVLNTYLVYLRFELLRGNLTTEEYQSHHINLTNYLEAQNKEHFNQFLSLWQKTKC